MYYDSMSAERAAQRLANETNASVLILEDIYSRGYYEIAHYNECKDLYVVDRIYPDIDID